MKKFLAVIVALLVMQGIVFSLKAPAPQGDASEKTGAQEAAAEQPPDGKAYPAWLLKTIAAEFTAVLDAGNNFLAAPSQKNLELFQLAKKSKLQRIGVHICKFDEASQLLSREEKLRLGDQLAGMVEAFMKNETALEARIEGVVAEHKRRQERLAQQSAMPVAERGQQPGLQSPQGEKLETQRPPGPARPAR